MLAVGEEIEEVPYIDSEENRYKARTSGDYHRLCQYSTSILGYGEDFVDQLAEWIDAGYYKKRWDSRRGKWFYCETFKQFMELPSPEGLGLNTDKAKKDLEVLRAGNVPGAAKVLARWEREQESELSPNGGDRKSSKVVAGNQCNIVTPMDRGNGTNYTMARLNRDGRDDLLEKVEQGELSLHQAALSAGIRKNRQLYVPRDAKAAAERLREKFGDEFVQEIKQYI